MLEKVNEKKIILASASPRRREILELLNLDFKVIEPINCEEVLLKNPFKTVISNSIIKAKNVYNNIGGHRSKRKGYGRKEQFLIAGFDTVVYFGRKYFGKPGSKGEAMEFLNTLAGRTHLVISGACVLDSVSGKYRFNTETTRVKFRKLTAEEIKGYTDKEYVLDKAGAYNIFGLGSMLVERINGCFYNVAGIPVVKFVDLLTGFGFKVIS